MSPKQLIKYSKILSKNFKGASTNLIYKELSNDKLWGQIPFTKEEKIIIAFLISIYLSGYDPELFYYEIETNLFTNTFDVVVDKGIEIECSNCLGRGEFDCEGCNGTGDKECPECEGDGEVWEDEYPEPCDTCQGGGEVECDYCDGTGLEECPECEVEGYTFEEDGCLIEHWVSYSWNKDYFNRFELTSIGEVVDSALFDNFWDDDKTLWVLSSNYDEVFDCNYKEHDSILLSFSKI